MRLRKTYEMANVLSVFAGGLLFLFALGAFNLPGYFFLLLTFVYLLLESRSVSFGMREIPLVLFSVSYFIAYTYYYDFEVKSLIVYLWGPWAAYLFGKYYVLHSGGERALRRLLTMITCGFFAHGVLNLIAYLRSGYYAQYAYQRLSVDFWRQDIVSVISTCLLLTFALSWAISSLFSACSIQKKLLCFAVLAVGTAEAAFFAYRSMILMIAILLVVRFVQWVKDAKVTSAKKAALICVLFLAAVLFSLAVYLNVHNIRTNLLSLKIVRRFISDERTSRLRAWVSFFTSGDWFLHPFGGQKMTSAVGGKWMHNLWLDIYNKAGAFPFWMFVIFTVTSLACVKRAVACLRARENAILADAVAYVVAGVMLICTLEPVIDANPYFFLAFLMILGGAAGAEALYKEQGAI